jgi:hypothetical protein
VRYIIDIDGTICSVTLDHQGDVDYSQSQPYTARIQHVNDLYDQGHDITYWTARGSASGIDRRELTEQQLAQWGAKYHRLELRKPVYDVWIDDKAHNSEIYFGETSIRKRDV